MITCEFELCAYNKDFACVLKQHTISPLGMCNECVIPNLPEDVVTTEKEKLLARLITLGKIK